MRQFEFTTSAMIDSWRCDPCDSEFAILTALRGKDEDGRDYVQVFNWGNPDRPPRCPHCGQTDVTRDEPQRG